MRLGRKVLAGALLILVGSAVLMRADEEAVRGDGQRVRGILSLDEKGGLRFLPADQEKPLPSETLESVRFDTSTAVRPRFGGSLCLLLNGGQHLTGELLSLDGERVQLRPAWSERIELPRSALLGLTHPPGYRTLFSDGLAISATAWKARGDTRTYELPTTLEAGRVGVTFQEKGKPSETRCRFETVFQTEAGPRTLAVTVSGPGDFYQIEAAGLKGETRAVRRSVGAHDLVMQFSKQSLRVTCDEDVLWFNLDQGPGGAFKQVSLSGLEENEAPARNAAVAWSAFYLARAIEPLRHPPGDPEQDEVWLASDDQLFGTIVGADGRAVQLTGRLGKRSLPWGDLCGIYFRRQKAVAARPEGQSVRVWLRTGFGSETDVLDGVLLKLDERRFTLQHADLGEVRLERKWLREIRLHTGKK